MKIDVALIPAEARSWQHTVCIVVDVLRASSTIVTLLDHGCRAVIPVRTLTEARRLRRALGHRLAGERSGLPRPDFDYGNSPSEFSQLDLAGQTIILTTGNGTAVLRQVTGAAAVLVGCFRNATACCRQAVSLALAAPADIGIVCAGSHRRFVLDDAVCAGFLVEGLAHMLEEAGADATLKDSATAAARLWQSYGGDILAAFRDSASGRCVARINHAADLAFCAQTDVSAAAPLVFPGPPPRIEDAASSQPDPQQMG